MAEISALRDALERAQRDGTDALAGAQRERAATEAALTAEIAVLREALDRAEVDGVALREVLASRSWRLTSPIRHAVKLIKR
jgi:hypothetical protein